MSNVQTDISAARVLITGATGFIGSRLAEILVLRGVKVRALVRNFARAARIARFPVDLLPGDVLDRESVDRAVKGCDIVFHCAYGNRGTHQEQRRVNVEGTGNVLEAARHAGIRRFVHLSTVMVYGIRPDGDLDESAPRRACGNVYADSKLEAEELTFDYFRKYHLPITVIQPTAVYGPFAPAWTITVLDQLKTGRVILVDDGSGFCNALYIDDLIGAIVSAAANKDAAGESFLISGDRPITWRQFYNRFEQMLNISGTVSMSRSEAHTFFASARKQRKPKSVFREALQVLREEPRIRRRLSHAREISAVRKIGRFLLPESMRQSLRERLQDNGKAGQATNRSQDGGKPVHPLDPFAVKFYAAKTTVRIEKAVRVLGYRPQFDFESGARLTEEWARWANLLNSQSL